MSSKILIVLAAFNGEAYLAEQLDSIRSQTLTTWKLLARDDGSTDNTKQVLKTYSQQDPRIQILERESEGKGSALENFSHLLEAALNCGAEYIFSCDQDDIWKPEKLAAVIAEMDRVRDTNGGPLLVHHDLSVVDDHLNLINNSFVGMMNIQPGNELNAQRLISRNEVTGCAMAFNRALLKQALPISKDAIMHDWWLAIFAAFFGRLHYMPQPLVKYRQHDANVIGAKNFWHGLNPFTNWVKGWRRGNKEFLDTVRQARAFQQALVSSGRSTGSFDVLELYVNLPSASRLQRIKSLRACNMWRSHWFLNAMLVLRMLLLPRSPV